MITIPMYYFMPQHGLRAALRPLFRHGTTTRDLINLDMRCGTTRNKFISQGGLFRIDGCFGIFQCIKVVKTDFTCEDGITQWELYEGWDFIFAKDAYPQQIYNGATQTIFKRLEENVQEEPQPIKGRVADWDIPEEALVA